MDYKTAYEEMNELYRRALDNEDRLRKEWRGEIQSLQKSLSEEKAHSNKANEIIEGLRKQVAQLETEIREITHAGVENVLEMAERVKGRDTLLADIKAIVGHHFSQEHFEEEAFLSEIEPLLAKIDKGVG